MAFESSQSLERLNDFSQHELGLTTANAEFSVLQQLQLFQDRTRQTSFHLSRAAHLFLGSGPGLMSTASYSLVYFFFCYQRLLKSPECSKLCSEATSCWLSAQFFFAKLLWNLAFKC